KLTADFPGVPDYRRDLADSYNNLGNLLDKPATRAEAEEQYRKAMAITERLVSEFPGVPEYQVSLAGNYCNFGISIRDAGQRHESLEGFDKAIHLLTADDVAGRQSEAASSFLRNSYWGRAQAYDRLKMYSEAVNDWDKVIDLTPARDQPALRASRAILKHRAGQTADAATEVAELTATDTNVSGSPHWNAPQWYNFA